MSVVNQAGDSWPLSSIIELPYYFFFPLPYSLDDNPLFPSFLFLPFLFFFPRPVSRLLNWLRRPARASGGDAFFRGNEIEWAIVYDCEELCVVIRCRRQRAHAPLLLRSSQVRLIGSCGKTRFMRNSGNLLRNVLSFFKSVSFYTFV